MGRRRITTAAAFGVAALLAGTVWADPEHETSTFVDEDGDGVADNAGTQPTPLYGPGLHGVFIDEDGDGVNDLAQDADGDGVVNGLDADYLKEKGIATGRGWMGHAFVDEDGDGVNDLAGDADQDGIPNGIDADYTLPEGAVIRTYGHGRMSGGFIDEDGDGVHDLAQDADGDGVPNGMDADYVRPEGTTAFRGGHGPMSGMAGFVDEDGDGINDLALDSDGDGIPNGMDSDSQGMGSRMGRGQMGHGGMSGGIGFVDEDGDGINDLMLDSDGDGVPNGMDGDYAAPAGSQRGRFGGGHMRMGGGLFVDVNADGVNDLVEDADSDGVPNGMDSDYVLPEGATTTGGMMGSSRGGMMGGSRGGMMGNTRGGTSENSRGNGRTGSGTGQTGGSSSDGSTTDNRQSSDG